MTGYNDEDDLQRSRLIIDTRAKIKEIKKNRSQSDFVTYSQAKPGIVP